MGEQNDIFQLLNQMLGYLPAGIGDTLYTVLIFIFVIAVLVFVHEWGHYRAALSVGVHVKQFSIGFGKELFSKVDKNGTRWKVCLIPLGGYVEMLGQEDGKPVGKSDDDKSFANKTILQRAWIIFAGPFVNFVFAFVVLVGLMMVGEHKLMPQVGEVMQGTPAERAGLQPNDIVRVVNETEIVGWIDMVETIQSQAGRDVQLVIERDGKFIPITIRPELKIIKNIFGEDKKVGQIGISSSQNTFKVYHNPLTAIGLGAVRTYELTELTLQSIWKLITGIVSVDQLAGPLGIADMASDTAKHGSYALFMFMVIISINLGIINLLPIPILDGGQLVFLLVESIKGSPVGERAQMWGIRFGLVFVACLIVVSTTNDIRRFEWIDRVGNALFSDAEKVRDK